MDHNRLTGLKKQSVHTGDDALRPVLPFADVPVFNATLPRLCMVKICKRSVKVLASPAAAPQKLTPGPNVTPPDPNLRPSLTLNPNFCRLADLQQMAQLLYN